MITQHQIPITKPLLWSVGEPNLYRVNIELIKNNVVVDSYSTNFGYRTIHFDADKGFFLNDQYLKIKGTCNHQDHAGIGSALPDKMHEFRIQKLKEMGCNAYRCAHHPPAKALLDACDKYGMLVMDENRNFNDAPDVIRQLETMVLRDRNHPSVILWSIFNEEMVQTNETGRSIALNMVRAIKRLDLSRPVLAAMNSVISDHKGVVDVVDVVGLNYFQFQYDDFHRLFPDKPVLSSENNCCQAERGVYITDTEKMYFASDDAHSSEFGNLARKSWQEINTRKFIAGSFIWTGFDYKGEPYPYKWPCISSHSGNIDSCGFPKSGFYLHQAFWTDTPMIHILPHWNHPGMEGKKIKVQVYTNCQKAELFLNGHSLGIKPVSEYDMPCWNITYAPGTLEAVGYIHNTEKIRDKVQTSGKSAKLILTPWQTKLLANGVDTTPVSVAAVDVNGIFVPNAMDTVHFNLEGNGKIIGTGNGNPTCLEMDHSSDRSLFNGLCQVIVQSGFETGKCTLTATAKDMEASRLVIPCKQAQRKPYIPSEKQLYIVSGWRKAPAGSKKPDVNDRLAEGDMNSWQHIDFDDNNALFNTGYTLLRAAANKANIYSPGTIVFKGLVGKAEIFVDKQLCLTKTSLAEEKIIVDIPFSEKDTMVIDVLCDCNDGEAGISKPVQIIY